MQASRRLVGLATVGLFGLFATMAAGCGDDGVPPSGDTIPPIDDEGPTADTEPPPAPAPTDSGAVEDVPDIREDTVVSVDESAAAGEIRALVRTIDVGETVHYAGFDVTVDDVAFGFDPAGFRVALVSVTLANDTPRADRLQTAVEIASQGTVAFIDRDMTPEVPSGGQATGAYSLRLDESFTFDDAVLFVGRPDRQRAEIPLGSTGELITREPLRQTDLNTGADDVSTITVDSVTVAWDSADPRGQAEPGQAYLHVDYTLETTVETAVNDDTIALVDPSGAVIEPVAATVDTVLDAPFELAASFLVADPATGDYVLRYTERFGRGVVDVAFSID